MPQTVDDSRVLSHADAAAAAAAVPFPDFPAPGAGSLPLPRTTLEAMSMVAYARANVRTAHTRIHTPLLCSL